LGVKDVSAQRPPSPSQASEPEHSLERRQRLLVPRCKFPPGREGPFGDDDKDDRGSIRESEQEDSDDSDDDDDKEAKRLREAARRVDWEDVKHIVEHPSEDERSVSFDESDDEDNENGSDPGRLKSEVDRQDEQSASEDDSEDEERASDSGRLRTEVEHPSEDEQSAPGDPVSGDEDKVKISASRRLKAEADLRIRQPIRGSRTASPEPEPEPEPEQEQHVSSGVSVSSSSESKVEVPAVQVAGDHQHRSVEERVIYTTRWPEPVSTPSHPPNPEALPEAAKAPECIPQQRSGCMTVAKGFL
jgi:hypothetical protein